MVLDISNVLLDVGNMPVKRLLKGDAVSVPSCTTVLEMISDPPVVELTPGIGIGSGRGIGTEGRAVGPGAVVELDKGNGG